MKTLTAQDILGLPLAREPVPIPELKGVVYVAELTEEGVESLLAKNDGKTRDVDWLVACCVDAEGAPLFKPEDAEALRKKSKRVMNLLVRKALEMNGFTSPSLGDTEKKSVPEDGGVSTSV